MSVEIRIEHPAEDTYVLRNVSGRTLSEVMVDAARIGAEVRNLPAGETLSDGEGVEFHMYKHGGTAPPEHMYVRWEGSNGWDEIRVG